MRPEAELLKNVSLFQLLDETEQTELASQLSMVKFAAGQEIFHYGDPGDSLYVISSGEVEVWTKNDTGERIVLEVATRGDFFGELSLLDQGTRTASVTAIQDTEALRLDRDHLQTFLLMCPGAVMHLLAAMGKRQRVTSERLRHTASRNVNAEVNDERTRVQKVADWIAKFTGSIPFLILHVIVFAAWLVLNIRPLAGFAAFDPYPFGGLTLAVSLESIFLSVFVLFSQNSLADTERVRGDIEYDVNLKAELEIAHLHEKIDRLGSSILTRLEKMKTADR